MDRLIYTALTGMNAAMDRQRAVANNLANASTPGFRAEEFAVTTANVKGPSFQVRAMVQGAVRGADMATGTVNTTGTLVITARSVGQWLKWARNKQP